MGDVFGQVDIVFVVDSTGSMAPFIDMARERIKKVLDDQATAGDLDLRVALVAYRDHPPQDITFVTDVSDFGDTDSFVKALDAMVASGGGDTPEAVLDGLLVGATLDWRQNADKSMYLVGDAPAHGVGCIGDAFVHGCPCHATPGGVVEIINSRGIRLNVISIGEDIIGFKDFAEACRGEYGMIEIERMAESMKFAAVSVGHTSDFVGMSRTYAAAIRETGSADHSVLAAHMGSSAAAVAGVESYLSTRGITPEELIKTTSTDRTSESIKKPKGGRPRAAMK